MTQDQKIIRNKLGLLKLAQTLDSVSDACKVLGFSRDSFYRFKELLRDRRRDGAGGDFASQAEFEEPGRSEESSRRWWSLRSSSRPTVRCEWPTSCKQAGAVGVAGGRAHDLAAPRSADLSAAAEGAVGEGGAGWPDPHRGPGARAREGQAGEGSARRDRDRAPGLPRLAGHVLRRQPEGRWADLPADLHRHVQQAGAS